MCLTDLLPSPSTRSSIVHRLAACSHHQVDHHPLSVFCQTSALFQSSIREGIKHYYDDLDFKNILDYVQQKVI